MIKIPYDWEESTQTVAFKALDLTSTGSAWDHWHGV